MTKTKEATSAQGAEVANVQTIPATQTTESKEKALAKFSNDLGTRVTTQEASAIFQSGVFEGDGVEVTNEMLNKEFWESYKDEPIPFIANSIFTEPEGRNGAYDIVTGQAVINGEIKNVSIPSTVVVSSIKNTGLGAYLITYKGMKRGKENEYANFSIVLKKTFSS